MCVGVCVSVFVSMESLHQRRAGYESAIGVEATAHAYRPCLVERVCCCGLFGCRGARSSASQVDIRTSAYVSKFTSETALLERFLSREELQD